MVSERLKGKGEKWGIRIVREPFERERGLMTYNVYIDTPKKRGFFVTNPAIQKAIKEGFGNKQLSLGEIKYLINEKERSILSYHFLPFGSGPISREAPRKAIKGRGAAGLIELAIIKDLNEKYPGFTFRRSSSVQKSRLRQLERMGIDPKAVYPIEEYYETILGVVRKGSKRARARKLTLRQRMAALLKRARFRRAK